MRDVVICLPSHLHHSPPPPDFPNIFTGLHLTHSVRDQNDNFLEFIKIIYRQKILPERNFAKKLAVLLLLIVFTVLAKWQLNISQVPVSLDYIFCRNVLLRVNAMVLEVVLGLETDPLVTDEESRVPCQLVQTITARWSCQPGEDGSPLFIFRNSSNLPTSSSIFVYSNIYFILNTFHLISFWWILSEDVTLENHWVSRMVIKSTLKWKQNQKLSFVASSVDSLFLIVDFLSGLDQCAEGTAAGTYSVIHLVALNIV